MRADSDGKPIKYYEVDLENVIIGSIDQVMHGGMGLHDNFTLKFSKVKWKYTQQKIAGGAGGTLRADGTFPPIGSFEGDRHGTPVAASAARLS